VADMSVSPLIFRVASARTLNKYRALVWCAGSVLHEECSPLEANSTTFVGREEH